MHITITWIYKERGERIEYVYVHVCKYIQVYIYNSFNYYSSFKAAD